MLIFATRTSLCSLILGLFYATPAAAQEENVATSDVADIVVTAQKREQRINDIGMSIQAATGDQLQARGITDTSQLDKIVPGFSATQSFYGTPVYTLRGVGFHDTSLAAAPTVSVYVDEIPLPYSIMTTGASLDIDRVEVLKGPQGTLFGANATGGAINYIAAKPSENLEAGFNASYGRFDTLDTTVFVSGPLSSTLRARVATRILKSGDWQKSYTRDVTWGGSDLLVGRLALEWEPSNRLSARLSLSGFKDRSDTQMPALYGMAQVSPTGALDPRRFNYPRAPNNPRAADWSDCVNNSPFNPPFGGTVYTRDDTLAGLRPTTATSCRPARKNNDFLLGSLRADWEIRSDITLSSLTALQEFNRDQFVEGDGTIYQGYESHQEGRIRSFYQEIRLAGSWGGQGNWVFGANFQRDNTDDHFLQSIGGSTSNPLALPTGLLAVGTQRVSAVQETTTRGAFFSAEYPVTDSITVQAGVRYTRSKRDFQGCTYDSGDGLWSKALQGVQNFLQWRNGLIPDSTYFDGSPTGGGFAVDVGPGGCGTSGPATGNYLAYPDGYTLDLNEDNISWRFGVNWTPAQRTLVYANLSRGYKAGAFSTVPATSYLQYAPAVQEELTAYEAGFKTSLLDNSLQLNGAVFYYDYVDKQLLGAVLDPVFGPLRALVNAPKSHVAGFELSADWRPVSGLRLTPVVSRSKSKVDGCGTSQLNCVDGDYFNYDTFGRYVKLSGQAFPNSPQWQASFDTQYDWSMGGDVEASLGGTLSYRSRTNGFFYNTDPGPTDQPSDILNIKGYSILDVRAGLEQNNWSLQIWGRNVTNKYYWVTATRANDVLFRYAGMPATYGVTVGYRY